MASGDVESQGQGPGASVAEASSSTSHLPQIKLIIKPPPEPNGDAVHAVDDDDTISEAPEPLKLLPYHEQRLVEAKTRWEGDVQRHHWEPPRPERVCDECVHIRPISHSLSCG